MVSGRRVREVGQLLKGAAGGNRGSELLETLGKVCIIICSDLPKDGDGYRRWGQFH